jgi:hypothetical protein
MSTRALRRNSSVSRPAVQAVDALDRRRNKAGWQEQAVVDADVEQRSPDRYSQVHGGMESLAPRPRVDVATGLAAMDRREPMWRGRESVADVVVAQRDGGNRSELRRAAVVECVRVDSE